MVNPELFITKGLLPENLPPVFDSRDLWGHYATSGSSYHVSTSIVGHQCVYNASKRSGQRRLFSIPHPIFAIDKALFFSRHWSAITALFAESSGSVSVPTLDSTASRYVRITPHRELAKIRLSRLSRFKHVLITDVSRFFHSIYTHSIPWAFHSKAVAKQDPRPNSPTVFGNRLDFILRQSQSRQTIGIPVGPDSSKIVSELLMASVDKHFQILSAPSTPVFVRHVDDYWIGGNSIEECERHLKNLRQALADHELDINETKTRIISSHFLFGEHWPSDFETEIEDSFGVLSSNRDPIATLSKIVDYAKSTGDDGAVRHAIKVLDEGHYWSRHWDILEHFLAQCAIHFPHSLDYVARVVAWRNRLGATIDKDLWTGISEDVISTSAALGRDSEVVWAMWLLKELDRHLKTSASTSIINNCGGLALAFLAHFGVRRRARDRNLFEKLVSSVDDDPFMGKNWPLTLELFHLGKEDATWSQATQRPQSQTLHLARVSIIKWDAPPRVFHDDGIHDDDLDPDHAIEDFGNHYGDSDDGSSEIDDERPDLAF